MLQQILIKTVLPQLISAIGGAISGFFIGEKWLQKSIDQEDWAYVGENAKIILKKGETRKIQVKECGKFVLKTDKKRTIFIKDVKVVCEKTEIEDCGGCKTGTVSGKASLIKIVVDKENEENPTIICLDDKKPAWPNSSVYFLLKTASDMRGVDQDRAYIEISYE